MLLNTHREMVITELMKMTLKSCLHYIIEALERDFSSYTKGGEALVRPERTYSAVRKRYKKKSRKDQWRLLKNAAMGKKCFWLQIQP